MISGVAPANQSRPYLDIYNTGLIAKVMSPGAHPYVRY